MDEVRGGAQIVAWNAIIFALLMLAADRFGASLRRMEQMTLRLRPSSSALPRRSPSFPAPAVPAPP